MQIKNFKNKIKDLAEADFFIKEGIVGGDKCYLITPSAGKFKYTKDELIFRSSIWTEDGMPVSLSWKKFFNYTEATDVVSDPISLDGAICVEKIDGSTCIVSRHNGELVIRSRGTFDISSLDNGYEKEFLLEKYKTFFNFVMSDENKENYSYIFEWTTPNNRIILSYGDEPELYFTGIINMDDYSYLPNSAVDEFAKRFGIRRPMTYNDSSFDHLYKKIKSATGIEGICIYYNEEQDIKKLKSDEYLMIHSFKFSNTYKKLINSVVDNGMSIIDYKKHIITQYDYECWEFVKDKVEKIYAIFDDLIIESNKCFKYLLNTVDCADRKAFAKAVMSDPECKVVSPALFKMLTAKKDNAFDVLRDDEGLRRFFNQRIKDILDG